jgi:AcrR family transcriptional regulator
MQSNGAVAAAPSRSQKRDRDVTIPAILAAAEIEFARYGFATARTESIAARANVVKGLIFHYFKSKEGLYEAVLVRAYQPLSEALDKSFDKDLSATDALLTLVERLLAVMTEQPLSPALLMLQSIQGGGEHFRKFGMPSLYSRVEALLKKGIASGEFREIDPWHGAINIIGLCGFYFCAANNISEIPGRSRSPLNKQSLARHTAEVMAIVRTAILCNS